MKRITLIFVAVIALASCAKTELVRPGNVELMNEQIGFSVGQQNMTKASTAMQNAGHYNFGVFAYKSTDVNNSIMDNYLVGYMDAAAKKGYYMTSSKQTTLGDASGQYNGKSQWQYEGLGSMQYDYTGTDGYYTKDQTAYMSNKENQYLRYWDLSAPSTSFFAYSPYVNGVGTPSLYVDGNSLTIPDGTVQHAYIESGESSDLCEFMYAAAKVASADYGKDVALNFKRLNAKVNIRFWENIEGYSVRILNLTDDYGVSAAPAKLAGDAYTQGEYFSKSGFTVDFTNIASPVVEQLAGTKVSDALKFTSPDAAEIGTTRFESTPSPTTYYAIPKDNTSGFTFHVSYELISDTGERIKVQDATVFVPGDYSSWRPNTSYTYVFLITNSSNGTTGDPGTIDPNDPVVKTENSLYPIVFDNCTVVDWEKAESDIIFNDNTQTTAYSVVLDNASVKASTGGTVTAELYEGTEKVAAPAGTWTVSGGLDISAAGVVTVPVDAPFGTYTVTYTLADSEKHEYHNHADSYSAFFNVIGNYTVSLSTSEIGTGGDAETTLQASTTVNGAAETIPSGTFSIVYPDGIAADKKTLVSVDNAGLVTVGTDAMAGDYKLRYTTDEGDHDAPFSVKNFGFTMSSSIVELSQTSQTVTIVGGVAATAPSVSTYVVSAGAGVSIDASTGTVTVAKDAATGKYTVTRTVDCSGSATVYKRTFDVKDAYTLALSQTTVDNDDNVTIAVTATKNGLSNVADVTYPVADGLTVDKTAGTIKVGASTAAGTYEVRNGDKTVTFLVQE